MSVGVLSCPDPTVAALPLRMDIGPWFESFDLLELEDTDHRCPSSGLSASGFWRVSIQELYIRKAVSSIILERLSYGAC